MTYSLGELILLIVKIILIDPDTNPQTIAKEIADRYNVDFESIWARLPQEYK